MEDKRYPIKTSMKVLFWILAVVCAVIIVGLPFTIIFLMMVFRAGITLKQDKLVHTWMKTREVPYSEISALSWGVRAGGIIGVMMGRPVHWHNREGKRQFWGFMVEAVENREDLLAELKARTGQAPV